MSHQDRTALIEQYATGPERLKAALAQVPIGAVRWRPGPGKWTVHEIIIHCADSETNAHMRLRYLLAEAEPKIVGYDQDYWAIALHYHDLPLEPALATITAVRANTVPLLDRVKGPDWDKTGHHTEVGAFSVAQWLEVYAQHLDQHVRQIQRNVDGWRRESGL